MFKTLDQIGSQVTVKQHLFIQPKWQLKDFKGKYRKLYTTDPWTT